MTKFIKINKKNTNIFFNNKNVKERNIDIINFNNGMIQEGEPIKEITRNDLKHSPNIGVKISQKTLNNVYKSMDIEMKDNIKKNNEYIFNINNNNKYLFATNKNYNSGIETKSKIRKNKNENKKDSFKNINIKIERQSVEIKGGNVNINDKRINNNEDTFRLNDYYFNGF